MTSWREAFIEQARSDNRIRSLLNKNRSEYAHELHYLQMASEKLAKGFMLSETAVDPPTFSHGGFVRFLRLLKGRPEIREALGYADAASFGKFIESVLPLALQVQQLAPSHARATQPNPEYPWRPTSKASVVVPAQFDFTVFSPTNLTMIRLDKLLNDLLRIIE